VQANAQPLSHQFQDCNVAQAWPLIEAEVFQLLGTDSQPAQFAQRLAGVSRQIMRWVAVDPDVAIYRSVAIRMDDLRSYGVLHSVHTAVVLSLIGLRKSWGDARIVTALQSALGMNISILKLQDDLALQVDPLSEEQRQAIHEHPRRSARLLNEWGVVDPEILTAVAQHHELSSGKGYPDGIRNITQLADALHTADVFAAKLSPRASRASLSTTRAAKEIFRQPSANYFGATVVKELGLYPPGSCVMLSNAEVAVVIRRGFDPMWPVVLPVIRADRAIVPLAERRALELGPQGVLKITDAFAASTLPDGSLPDAEAWLSLSPTPKILMS
jgi:HD-GYP domain-containing protein (c-di-GMP phosphodiesterase class II)